MLGILLWFGYGCVIGILLFIVMWVGVIVYATAFGLYEMACRFKSILEAHQRPKKV